MSTEKEPDYKGIGRKLAEAHFCQAAFEADPSIEQTYGWDQMLISADADRIEGYASCMEARLRSDWETIRLLRMGSISHPYDCGLMKWRRESKGNPSCTCGIDAHLSKLLEPFT